MYLAVQCLDTNCNEYFILINAQFANKKEEFIKYTLLFTK